MVNQKKEVPGGHWFEDPKKGQNMMYSSKDEEDVVDPSKDPSRTHEKESTLR